MDNVVVFVYTNTLVVLIFITLLQIRYNIKNHQDVFDMQDNKPGLNKNNDWKDLQYVNAASNIQKHPNDINGNFEKMRDIHILEQANMSLWDKQKKN